MQIGRKDLFWNYAATSMRVLSGLIVMPFTLHMLPSEEIAIWTILLNLINMTVLLDFGFSNFFSRNITLVFSGVKELKVKGYAIAETSEIDYGLLKTLLSAVKRYYGVVALIFITVFVAATPFYLPAVLANFSGDTQLVWIAWIIFGGALAYELYTYCYNALLLGRGMVKRSTQITVLSHSIRIVVTIILLFLGLRILAIVLGILISDLINRVLLHRVFYDRETKRRLANATSTSVKGIIKTLAPNSLRTGCVILSNFLRKQIIVFIAPFYFSLTELAEYGISERIISIMPALGLIWFNTFYAKLSQYRVQGDMAGVKRLYIKGKLALIVVFALAGGGLLLWGADALALIKSNTSLLCNGYLSIMMVFSFLEANKEMANHMFLTKNEVPFYKADIASGFLSLALLALMLYVTSWGILSLILASGVALCAYLNWKIPLAVRTELSLGFRDYCLTVKQFYKENSNRK